MTIQELKTPAYVLDEAKLIQNLTLLAEVQKRAGCKILLAQKAFSMFCEYPLIGQYLAGTTASGLYEARLGREEMGKETHIFAPSFRADEIDEIASVCDHISFNSIAELERYGARVRQRDSGMKSVSAGDMAADVPVLRAEDSEQKAVVQSGTANHHTVSVGLRVNPEHSTQSHAIYDPCAPGSRLGAAWDVLVREAGVRFGTGKAASEVSGDFEAASAKRCRDAGTGAGKADCRPDPDAAKESVRKLLAALGVEGLHMHTLCEQNADDLEETFAAFERRFGGLLHDMKWFNLGGGHHITRPDYMVDRLVALVRRIRETYDVEVYLEPGEAIALDAGYLVTEIMDIVENAGVRTLILDTSAACHMPDVLEMPYRPRVLYAADVSGGESAPDPERMPCLPGLPRVLRAGEPGISPYTYRLSSCTCLAGDVIGDYAFARELKPGDRLYFEDMAIYSMVKNNTFNGIRLPDLVVMDAAGDCRLQKRFGYEDFRMRLS